MNRLEVSGFVCGLKASGSPIALRSARNEIVLAPAFVVTAQGRSPLLGDLMATGAGYLARAGGPLRRATVGAEGAALLYCVSGAGWCDMGGRLHPVRPGDLLVLPPGTGRKCGGHLARPWTLHWVHLRGRNLPVYLAELGTSAASPVVRVGDDLQIVRLFNEILRCLQGGSSFVNLFRASQALGHLLAVLIEDSRQELPQRSDTVQKVAESIILMSERLDQPLRVEALARLANLSTAHFSALFKQQAGCSPRDYLHLLRIHRACQLLRDSGLHVKEIAGKLGYKDQFHFSRQFKAFQGVSPTQYRESGGI